MILFELSPQAELTLEAGHFPALASRRPALAGHCPALAVSALVFFAFSLDGHGDRLENDTTFFNTDFRTDAVSSNLKLSN